MPTRTAAAIQPGDTLIAPNGDTATVFHGPARSTRAPGKIAFLARRNNGRVVTITVHDTDRLEITR
jgi:hypothetical protein